ncbi:MAG: type I glyceraldehyde-3-phosphate dehydrogenase [Aestuariibacter sp.]|nr:type I glyceraldehyde-3-phosphate dehydrogenase [Aestuariibacter sp.]MCP4376898.1 type I glyceraldehyde-3-phosphate dehydrogenase [bacterium]MCP4543663.1 type I glyceraldehyde-3-phosphate dehydrogenase [Chloroflexota bacterium]MCP4949050.1 type I glyceraldehyde-3-phosphate dehydrogenase [Aestuariibacter sp.]
MTRFAINGAGRIGRLVMREYLRRQPDNLQLVAVNDLTDTETLAYLLEFDSVHGRLPSPVAIEGDQLCVAGVTVPVYHQAEPERLPWSDLGVDWVLEGTGLFRKREDASKHLAAGAGKVLISAPSESADLTIIYGVNHHAFQPESHQIISNGSCTTNSLVPPLAVLLESYGIDTASATTIHAYTSSQGLVDVASRKRIRGRAAALNLVPTSTGADKVVAAVLPELAGKFSALAVRAPIPDGGLTDITVRLQQPVTEEQVNQCLADACKNQLQGVMDFTEQEWVSSDIIGNSHSAIIHGLSTRVIGDRTVKLQVWYDNEYAYACRLLDLLASL